MEHIQNVVQSVKSEKKKHMKGWTKDEHYTNLGCWCGQSCPCCRAEHGQLWGACTICSKMHEFNKL